MLQAFAVLVWQPGEFARPGVGPVHEDASGYDADPDTRSKGDSGKDVLPRAAICAGSTKGKTVGIVVYTDGNIIFVFKFFLQMHFLPGRNVGSIVNYAVDSVHHRRNANSNRGHIRTDYPVDC